MVFGGKPLQGHSIPERYGAIEPTAVFVPLKEILKSEESFALATTEVFGPLQVHSQLAAEQMRSIPHCHISSNFSTANLFARSWANSAVLLLIGICESYTTNVSIVNSSWLAGHHPLH